MTMSATSPSTATVGVGAPVELPESEEPPPVVPVVVPPVLSPPEPLEPTGAPVVSSAPTRVVDPPVTGLVPVLVPSARPVLDSPSDDTGTRLVHATSTASITIPKTRCDIRSSTDHGSTTICLTEPGPPPRLVAMRRRGWSSSSLALASMLLGCTGTHEHARRVDRSIRARIDQQALPDAPRSGLASVPETVRVQLLGEAVAVDDLALWTRLDDEQRRALLDA